MKKTITLAALFIFIVAKSFAIDGYLNNLNIGTYVKTNNNYTISVYIKNLSGSLTSCTVSWKLGTGAVTSTPFNIGGGGVVSNNYLPATLTGALNFPSAGPYVLKIWITATGDSNHANDTLTLNTIALSTYANGKVLIEELTGTWCPNCPPGLNAIDTIAKNPNAVPASFHGGDSYSFTNGLDHMQKYYYPSTSIYYPSAIINMGEMGTFPISDTTGYWQQEVALRVGISPVAVNVTASFNATTRLLTVTYGANFKYALTGDFHINSYILENNVVGSQNNLGTYMTWHFNHMVRNMLGGLHGDSLTVPSTPILNTNYNRQDTMTIPATWNASNLEVIAFVFQQNGTKTRCLNADSYSFATGIEKINLDNSISVFPNPSTGIITIQSTLNNLQNKSVEVYNVIGEKIYSSTINSDRLDIDLSKQAKGVYFVQLQSNEGIATKKIIIQ